mgnify:CR=1 FL=1
MATETKRMRVRQSDSATAKSKNETLRLGEFFYETDTGEIKIGDGVTKYNALLGVRSEAKIAQALASGVYKGQDLSIKFASEIANMDLLLTSYTLDVLPVILKVFIPSIIGMKTPERQQ